jgi:hypothetical protein
MTLDQELKAEGGMVCACVCKFFSGHGFLELRNLPEVLASSNVPPGKRKPSVPPGTRKLERSSRHLYPLFFYFSAIIRSDVANDHMCSADDNYVTVHSTVAGKTTDVLSVQR